MRRLNLLYLLPALAFLSCSEDSSTDPLTPEEQTTGTIDVLANVEAAYPNEIGKVSEVYFAGQKIAVEEIDGEYIFEGDIMFTPDMLSNKEQKLVYEPGEKVSQKSVGRTSGRWPNNTVYYSIDSNLSGKERVTDAIKHWEANTSLKFVQRSSQSNYVYFTSGSGCSSYVGMIGGKQNITLSTSCSTGNTIHEIGHAIGLWHEQSRVDRSNHIQIHYDNIQSGREHNFKTYAENGADGKEFTSSLDFGSIMMYGPYSFSSNGQPTITKTNGSTYSVQRTALSSGDKQGINSMYPGGTTEPTYINGETYVIYGVTVLRHNDLWYYYSRTYGWKQVVLIGTYWYYAR
ncbi:peptidase M12 [Antarcticibacterium arcticum]|uniref:Peptidase M12 n=1 Tax=Antarcticibacterium arcticum TaxID=2585771 RepID=A0A5B8YF01_9FLAO|nr:M12 family metallopeptidase [Antarcticibacterium arcticum]QED36490.1 peptidase M12 [Antarcticibacterium arcticum]